MPIKTRNDLTADEVRAALDYDPVLGILRWKPNPARSKAWNTRRAGKAAGSVSKATLQVQVRLNDVLYLAHRLIWLMQTGTWPAEEIDHRNGNDSDNRWENLREATRNENIWNRTMHKGTKSGFLGVRYRPHHGKWEARIAIGGKVVWHAYASTAQEASAMRRAILPKFHGEFIREHHDPVEP